jgi:uncharacterized protein (DUF1499 family)
VVLDAAMIWLGRAVLVLLAALVVYGLWVRLAPSVPAHWHVDPLTAPDPGSRNFARLSPGEVRGTDPASLARQVQAAMEAMPRTRLLAGSAEELHMTFITRSRLWGFPDYTSVRILAADGGATLAAFARARFGSDDLGVNAARLAALAAALATP